MTMVRMTATARVALPPALVLSIMSSGCGGSGSGGGGGFLDHGKRIVDEIAVSKLTVQRGARPRGQLQACCTSKDGIRGQRCELKS